jgi:hypothetical protein
MKFPTKVCAAAILGWGLQGLCVLCSISTCVQLSRNVTDSFFASTICCIDRFTLLGVWGGDQNESEACRHITDKNEPHSHVSLHYYKCGCLHAKDGKVGSYSKPSHHPVSSKVLFLRSESVSCTDFAALSLKDNLAFRLIQTSSRLLPPSEWKVLVNTHSLWSATHFQIP